VLQKSFCVVGSSALVVSAPLAREPMKSKKIQKENENDG
jgi:hypothetical protein